MSNPTPNSNRVRCILFWVDGILVKYDESSLFESLIGLDSYVEDGCVGQLLSVNTPQTTETYFNQLLGFQPEASPPPTYDEFKKKYKDLNLRVLSSSQSFCEGLSGKGFECTHVDDYDKVVKIINDHDVDIEMVIVHVQTASTEECDRKRTILTADHLIHQLYNDLPKSEQQQNRTIFIGTILSFAPDHSDVEIPLTEEQAQSKAVVPDWFKLPAQSTEFFEGKPFQARQTSPMFVVNSHPIVTRKDCIKGFKDTEFIKGSSGKMLIMQYLRGLAFKMGHAEKYGA
ncbi:hypothetical protein SAMD00019534_109650 [Acytostelium subglobosum LB1]|uniref:hypothetical protein n=1 Tax=Acytostelium subglobosum LB1 TaxID=1410327 RepID=UPI000644C68C|nr:hypothetical protein SAMD00019534_109650 [Acytostelium subglobosum LB1]GAM27789.1 hypothetical protein SAMD00019534_109650 [Acytostelium subglobosum LB1]|eukprot:XP_012749448.1 hypothetical protein SAMD00019534_109650 [Acytostelium subglobosum LB1]